MLQMRQAMAEARRLKPTGYRSLPDDEGWTLSRSCPVEKKERAIIADQVREQVRKRKASPETQRCYGCGKVGHCIVNCPAMICFGCNGKGHCVPECPWNPHTKAYLPMARWAPRRKVGRMTATPKKSSKDNNKDSEGISHTELTVIPREEENKQLKETEETTVAAPKDPIFVPYIDHIIKRQANLACRMGILLLVHGESNVDGRINVLRAMSDTFN